jgi:hypothetical protein
MANNGSDILKKNLFSNVISPRAMHSGATKSMSIENKRRFMNMSNIIGGHGTRALQTRTTLACNR